MNTPEETLDMMRDEFARIAAENSCSESIRYICQRAMMDITYRVPLIVQRDRAESELVRVRNAILCAIAPAEQTKKREPYPPIPEDMKPAVDKLREGLYDNPCCLGDEDGSVHFLSDAELYYAIKAVIPFLQNSQAQERDSVS